MAHAAKIENGTVVQVIVIPDGIGGDENDAAICKYINDAGLDGTWVRTSYNGNIRGCYAGIGYTYDSVANEFLPPVAEPVVGVAQTVAKPSISKTPPVA